MRLVVLASLLLPLIGSGCRAQPAATPTEPLQFPVPAPPPLQTAESRLWVALAARLGGEEASAPLELRSATGLLTVQDASGRRWQDSRFTLGWRRLPLAQPLLLHRLVAGPFASFETAERQALLWRQLGVPVTLAQPGDWELWAPPGSPLPRGWSVRHLQQRHTTAVVPLLQVAGRPGQRLEGPVRIEAPGGLVWQGGVYGGPFRLQADALGSWTLVELVPLERYLEGVVPHEIGAASPPAALAAQAVLARTWALRNQHRYAADGYHLCATTQCQVYSDPRQAGAAVRTAIIGTRHQLLRWQGQPIQAVYHASNGGMAAGLEEAWDALPVPYLRPGPDAAGSDHPRFRWTLRLDRHQIAAALARRGLQLGQIQRLQVLERGASGRVVALAIEGRSSRTVLRLDAIRRTLRGLPSTLFELLPQADGGWLLEGRGFGHGAGLSQAGAIDLARRGWSFVRILERYYPGAHLESLLPGKPAGLGSDP